MITPQRIRPRPARRARLLLPVAALAALLALPALAATGQAAAPADSPGADPGADPGVRLANATTGEGVLRHLAAFQRIADASDGTRAAGTPGHERSARYAGRLLRAAGYHVTYQRFTFPYRETLAERLTLPDSADTPDTPDAREVPVRVMTYSPSTPPGGLTAELAPPPAPRTGCTPDAYDPAAVTGRIALIERGTCTFAEKQAAAAEAGAVAAIISNDAPGALAGTLGEPDAGVIPTAGVSRDDGAALAAVAGDAAAGPLQVRLELVQHAEDRTTVNVLATTPGGSRRTVVMAGAHLDSVAEGPGINDNASGAAALLETALRLAETDAPHPHAVRFALWSAEESGLLGSGHYVSGLTDRQREHLALYLNFDMIGSPNPGWFVYDGDAVEPDAPGSARIEHDLAGFLAARGHPTRPAALDGRSDYAPFLDAGVPVGGLFTGAEGVMTGAEARLWGGEEGAPYDACYHAACDDLDNISTTALTSSTQAIAHAVGSYAWHAPDPADRP